MAPPSFTIAARLALALAVSASYGAGCGTDPPPVDASVPTLEIGTGETEFTPIDDGGTVELHLGCQGSQHVWVTLRSRGVSPTQNIVNVSTVRLRDDLVTSVAITARLSFVQAADSAVLAGLPMQIEDPATVLGEDIEIRATIRDRSGVYAMATKRVAIVWGAPACGSLTTDGAVRSDADGGGVIPALDAGALDAS